MADKKHPPPSDEAPPAPLRVDTERDLRRNIREICERINARPDIARLVLVNPILAFEDAGVELGGEVKKHIRNTLGKPAKLAARHAELSEKLQRALAELCGDPSVPETPAERARLLFDRLGLRPRRPEDRDGVDLRRLGRYVREHELVQLLHDTERSARGGVIFHTRASYRDFKEGRQSHRWLRRLRFKV